MSKIFSRKRSAEFTLALAFPSLASPSSSPSPPFQFHLGGKDEWEAKQNSISIEPCFHSLSSGFVWLSADVYVSTDIESHSIDDK